MEPSEPKMTGEDEGRVPRAYTDRRVGRPPHVMVQEAAFRAALCSAQFPPETIEAVLSLNFSELRSAVLSGCGERLEDYLRETIGQTSSRLVFFLATQFHVVIHYLGIASSSTVPPPAASSSTMPPPAAAASSSSTVPPAVAPAQFRIKLQNFVLDAPPLSAWGRQNDSFEFYVNVSEGTTVAELSAMFSTLSDPPNDYSQPRVFAADGAPLPDGDRVRDLEVFTIWPRLYCRQYVVAAKDVKGVIDRRMSVRMSLLQALRRIGVFGELKRQFIDLPDDRYVLLLWVPITRHTPFQWDGVRDEILRTLGLSASPAALIENAMEDDYARHANRAMDKPLRLVTRVSLADKGSIPEVDTSDIRTEKSSQAPLFD